MEDDKCIFEIVVGTYEQFLLGYKLLKNAEGAYSLKLSFSNHAHDSSIRCIASCEKFLASGGTDEAIHLFNLRTRQELGSLLQHNGTVTALAFYDTFMLSSSDDGSICVWNTKNWQCEKTLHGHKSAVNSVSLHPSGKMAFSVSADKTLRTWNLIKGRSAYVTNIKKVADLVKCSPCGSSFVICCGDVIDVYSVQTAEVTQKIDFQKKILSVDFISEDICAIGGEDEHILLWDLKEKCEIQKFKAHTSRIKSIEYVTCNGIKFLVTVSSDGYIKIWKISLKKSKLIPEEIAEIKISNRPTCLTVLKTELNST